MLELSWVVAQLAASQEGLSSMKFVSCLKKIFFLCRTNILSKCVVGYEMEISYADVLIIKYKCSRICNMEHISCTSSTYICFRLRGWICLKTKFSTFSQYKCVVEHELGKWGWLCWNAISQLTEKFNYREDFSVQLSKSRTAKPQFYPKWKQLSYGSTRFFIFCILSRDERTFLK
jgi:hypothetical protein